MEVLVSRGQPAAGGWALSAGGRLRREEPFPTTMCFSLSLSWKQAADVTVLFSRRVCAAGPSHKRLFKMQRGQCVLLSDGSLSYSDTWQTLVGLEQPLVTFMVHACVSCHSPIMCLFICVCVSEEVHLQLYIIHHQQPNTRCTSITTHTLLFEPSKTKSRKKHKYSQANMIWVFDYIALILDFCYQCIMTSCVCHALCFSEI